MCLEGLSLCAVDPLFFRLSASSSAGLSEPQRMGMDEHTPFRNECFKDSYSLPIVPI